MWILFPGDIDAIRTCGQTEFDDLRRSPCIIDRRANSLLHRYRRIAWRQSFKVPGHCAIATLLSGWQASLEDPEGKPPGSRDRSAHLPRRLLFTRRMDTKGSKRSECLVRISRSPLFAADTLIRCPDLFISLSHRTLAGWREKVKQAKRVCQAGRAATFYHTRHDPRIRSRPSHLS